MAPRQLGPYNESGLLHASVQLSAHQSVAEAPSKHDDGPVISFSPPHDNEVEPVNFEGLGNALDDDEDEDVGLDVDWPRHDLGSHRGVEIFVGGLTRSTRRDMLRDWFEHAGEVTEVRIARDKRRRRCRGYGYVRFATSEQANRAIETMHRYEFKHGRFLGVLPSDENRTLFVGGLKEEWNCDYICQLLKEKMPGLRKVEPIPDREDRKKIRTFCFLEFNTHEEAAVVFNRHQIDHVDRPQRAYSHSSTDAGGGGHHVPDTFDAEGPLIGSTLTNHRNEDICSIDTSECGIPQIVEDKNSCTSRTYMAGVRNFDCSDQSRVCHRVCGDEIREWPWIPNDHRDSKDDPALEDAKNAAYMMTRDTSMATPNHGSVSSYKVSGTAAGKVPLVIGGAILKVDWADPLRYHIHLNGGIKGPSAPTDWAHADGRSVSCSSTARLGMRSNGAPEWSSSSGTMRQHVDPASASQWWRDRPACANHVMHERRHHYERPEPGSAQRHLMSPPSNHGVPLAMIGKDGSFASSDARSIVASSAGTRYNNDMQVPSLEERGRARAMSVSYANSNVSGFPYHARGGGTRDVSHGRRGPEMHTHTMRDHIQSCARSRSDRPYSAGDVPDHRRNRTLSGGRIPDREHAAFVGRRDAIDASGCMKGNVGGESAACSMSGELEYCSATPTGVAYSRQDGTPHNRRPFRDASSTRPWPDRAGDVPLATRRQDRTICDWGNQLALQRSISASATVHDTACNVVPDDANLATNPLVSLTPAFENPGSRYYNDSAGREQHGWTHDSKVDDIAENALPNNWLSDGSPMGRSFMLRSSTSRVDSPLPPPAAAPTVRQASSFCILGGKSSDLSTRDKSRVSKAPPGFAAWDAPHTVATRSRATTSSSSIEDYSQDSPWVTRSASADVAQAAYGGRDRRELSGYSTDQSACCGSGSSVDSKFPSSLAVGQSCPTAYGGGDTGASRQQEDTKRNVWSVIGHGNRSGLSGDVNHVSSAVSMDWMPSIELDIDRDCYSRRNSAVPVDATPDDWPRALM